jgi:hypothetical protein
LKVYVKTEAHRRGISASAKGKAKRLGATLSSSSKSLIASSLRRHFAQHGVSEETRQKLSKAMTGKTFGQEFKNKCQKSALSRKKMSCPICGGDKLYDGGNLKRHMKRHEKSHA